jgi:uncharacterized protein (TIGR01568 family)
MGLGAAGVALPTYSPDPHADFLKSMEEMSAALRLDARRRGNRARLHELLLCYLALNDKRTHRYIVLHPRSGCLAALGACTPTSALLSRRRSPASSPTPATREVGGAAGRAHIRDPDLR